MYKLLIRTRHLIFKEIIKLIKFPEPAEFIEPGCSKKAYEFLFKNNCKKTLIVTDKSLIKLNIIDGLIESLRDNEIDYLIYNGVNPNPTIENVEEGIKVYNENKCDSIIAFGGGSSIDCAKIIAAKISNNKEIYDMKGLFKLRSKLPLLIAIPTTAGTGSEVTVAAVITNVPSHEKFVINDTKLIPRAFFLDAELLLGLPKDLTASTGMDALTHAVEAFIGWHGTQYTDEYSLKAIKIINDSLEKSYADGNDLNLRNEMLKASNYAGKAFTRASIGYVHAVAHNLGGLYGTPHGLTNAIVLPYILEASKDKASKKIAEISIYIGLGDSNDSEEMLTDKFIDRVREMNFNMRIPEHMDKLRKRDIPYLAQLIEKEGNPGYPVPKILKCKDFEKILNLLLTV